MYWDVPSFLLIFCGPLFAIASLFRVGIGSFYCTQAVGTDVLEVTVGGWFSTFPLVEVPTSLGARLDRCTVVSLAVPLPGPG